jgi:hypothetical protein
VDAAVSLENEQARVFDKLLPDGVEEEVLLQHRLTLPQLHLRK